MMARISQQNHRVHGRKRTARVFSVQFAQLIACLAMITLVLIAFLSQAPQALANTYEIGEKWVNTNSTKVEICKGAASCGESAWKPYTSGMMLDYGDGFRMQLHFNVPDNIPLQAGDKLVYALPHNGLHYVANQTYKLRDSNGNEVGTYMIRSDGTNDIVDITYNGANNLSNISGFVTIDGDIVANSEGNNNGGKSSFNFTGYGDVIVNLNPKHEIRVQKNGAITVPNEPSLFDFVLDVTSTGTNSAIILRDTMGSYLRLQPDSLKIYKDPEFKDEYKGSYSLTPNASNDGFTVHIDSMNDNEKLYVKYRVVIDRSQVIEACKDFSCERAGTTQYNNVNNAVEIRSKEDTSGNRSDKGIWLTDTISVKKSGAEDVQGNSASIHWTIEITPGANGIVTGATIQDILSSGLKEPTSKPTITCYGKNNIWWPAYDCSTNDFTWEAMKNGTATLPQDPNNNNQDYGRYVITYDTAVTDDTITQAHRNKAIVHTPYRGDKEAETTVTPRAQVNVMKHSKNYSNGKLTWQTTFTANRDFESVTLTDSLDIDSAGNSHGTMQTLDPSSIGVFYDYDMNRPVDPSSYTITYPQSNKFEITFTNVKMYQTFYIRYSTQLADSVQTNGGTVYNTAQSLNASTTATYTVQKKDVDNMTKESTWYYGNRTNTGKFRWRLKIHDVSSDAQTITITDTLPENQKYLENTLYALTQAAWDSYAGLTIDGAEIQDNGDTVLISLEPGSQAFERAKTSQGVYLQYETQIIDYQKIDYQKAEGHKEYVNTATISVDGFAQKPDEAKVWRAFGKPIEKKGTYETSTAPFITYKITANPGGMQLNEGRTLVITDDLPKGLALSLGSVIVRRDDSTILPGATYAYNPETRKLTFRIPDGTAAVITYTARVQLAVGQQINGQLTNKVTLEGLPDSLSTDKDEQLGEVLHTQGYMTGVEHGLQIFKYADSNIAAPMNDISFTIEPLIGEESGGVWKVTDVANGTRTVKTKSQGDTDLIGMETNIVYRVTEKTPVGFEPSDPLYIVYPKDKQYPNKVIDGEETYPLTLAQSGTGDHAAPLAAYIWTLNNNHATKASLRIKKTDMAGRSLEGASVQLIRADGTYEASWKCTAEGATTCASFEIKDLHPGTYLLQEVKAPTGYKLASDITIQINADGTVTQNGSDITTVTIHPDGTKEFSALVTMQDAPLTEEISVEKTWNDDNNRDGIRDDAIFDLYRKFEGSSDDSWEKIEGQTQALRADGTQNKLVWKSLPQYVGSQRAQYEIREREISGYKSSCTSQAVDKGMGTAYKCTNTHTPAVIAVHVKKNWEKSDTEHPSSVKFQLLADGVSISEKTLVLNAGNNWQGSFTDLPQSKDGHRIAYSIQEEVPEGYTAQQRAQIDEDGSITIDVTNSKEHKTLKPQRVRIAKRSTATQALIAGATLKLTGIPDDGTVYTPFEWVSDGDTHVFHLLPGLYTLQELRAPDGYARADDIVFRVLSNGNMEIAEETMSANIIMDDDVKKTPVVISKTAEEGLEQLQGAHLLVTGQAFDDTQINEEWVSDKDPHLMDLPNGTYTLTETQAPVGYDIIDPIVFRVYNGVLVVNKVVQQGTTVRVVNMRTKLTSVKVSKQWQDDNNKDRLRPDSVRVQLLADNVPLGAPRVLNADNKWMATWTDLPARNKDRTTISYTVRELMEGDFATQYRAAVSESQQEDGVVYQIVNIHEPDSSNTVNLAINKQWDDANNQDGKRPASIDIDVLASVSIPCETTSAEQGQQATPSGPEHAQKTCLSAPEKLLQLRGLKPNDQGKWQWKVYGLPARDEKGRAYTFSIQEMSAITPDYVMETTVQNPNSSCNEKRICAPIAIDTNERTQTFELTNVHMPEVVNFEVSKVWDDARAVQDNNWQRPTNVSLWLVGAVRNEQSGNLEQVTTDSTNSSFWPTPQYTFEQEGFTFEQPPKPFDSITQYGKPLSLEADGTCVTGSYAHGKSCVNLTQADKQDDANTWWRGSFTGLPKYYRGKEILYRITEQQAHGYMARELSDEELNSLYATKTPASSESTKGAQEDADQSVTQRMGIVNQAMVELPHTGAEQQILGAIGALALVTMIVMSVVLLRASSEDQQSSNIESQKEQGSEV